MPIADAVFKRLLPNLKIIVEVVERGLKLLSSSWIIGPAMKEKARSPEWTSSAV